MIQHSGRSVHCISNNHKLITEGEQQQKNVFTFYKAAIFICEAKENGVHLLKPRERGREKALVWPLKFGASI